MYHAYKQQMGVGGDLELPQGRMCHVRLDPCITCWTIGLCLAEPCLNADAIHRDVQSCEEKPQPDQYF